MAVQSSAAARQALGETWQNLIGTDGYAWIEFYSSPMPKSPDEPVREERLLFLWNEIDRRNGQRCVMQAGVE
jgi:hypothetical protein